MKTIALAIAPVLLLACSSPTKSERDVLMDRIERQVKLPEGARPLKDYARYYANGERGEIEAIYVIPFSEKVLPGEICEELLENFATKQVPCTDLENPFDLPAGQRRWVKDRQHLPAISDGGCDIVNVRFDPSIGKIMESACNGVA